ncbi:hypothetical protein ACFZ8E_06320 [Methylobacterium sp. HMF5984]|uniref:hypothetical protein n=1 Tax=Methylobacterium sp. HMF5984 TaxID=3367370 RepID=UPI003854F255
MTALNIFCEESRADIWSDGAYLRPDGTLDSIASKVVVLGGVPAAVAVAGPSDLQLVVMLHLAARFASYDDLCDGAVEALRNHPFGDDRLTQSSFAWAGWSERRQRITAHVVTSEGIPGGLEAWQRGEAWRFINPNPPQLVPGLARRGLDLLKPDAITEDEAASLMRAQRALRMPLRETLGESIVGGFMQHTVVTRDEISTRVVERWPDVIGQMIAA